MTLDRYQPEESDGSGALPTLYNLWSSAFESPLKVEAPCASAQHVSNSREGDDCAQPGQDSAASSKSIEQIEQLAADVQSADSSNSRKDYVRLLEGQATNLNLIELLSESDLNADRRSAVESMSHRVDSENWKHYRSYIDPAWTRATLAFAKIGSGKDKLIAEGERTLIKAVSMQPALLLEADFQKQLTMAYQQMEGTRKVKELTVWRGALESGDKDDPESSSNRKNENSKEKSDFHRALEKANQIYRESGAQESIEYFETAIKAADNQPEQKLKNDVLQVFIKRLEIERAVIAKDVRNQKTSEVLLNELRNKKEEEWDKLRNYLAVGSVRANAGLAMISSGEPQMLSRGKNYLCQAIEKRPELEFDADYRDKVKHAFSIHNKNRATDNKQEIPAGDNSNNVFFEVGFKQIDIKSLSPEQISDIEKDEKIRTQLADDITGPALAIALLYLGYRAVKGQILRIRDKSSVETTTGESKVGEVAKPEGSTGGAKEIPLAARVNADPHGRIGIDEMIRSGSSAPYRNPYSDATLLNALLSHAERAGMFRRIGINRSDVSIELNRNMRYQGYFIGALNETLIKPSTGSATQALRHELQHMARSLERTALMMADPQAYRDSVLDSVLAQVGTGAKRVSFDHHRTRNYIALSRSNLTLDGRKLLRDALIEAVKTNSSPSEILGRPKFESLRNELPFRRHPERLIEELASELEHYKTAVNLSTIDLAHMNPDLRSILNRKVANYKRIRSESGGTLRDNPELKKFFPELHRYIESESSRLKAPHSSPPAVIETESKPHQSPKEMSRLQGQDPFFASALSDQNDKHSDATKPNDQSEKLSSHENSRKVADLMLNREFMNSVLDSIDKAQLFKGIEKDRNSALEEVSLNVEKRIKEALAAKLKEHGLELPSVLERAEIDVRDSSGYTNRSGVRTKGSFNGKEVGLYLRTGSTHHLTGPLAVRDGLLIRSGNTTPTQLADITVDIPVGFKVAQVKPAEALIQIYDKFAELAQLEGRDPALSPDELRVLKTSDEAKLEESIKARKPAIASKPPQSGKPDDRTRNTNDKLPVKPDPNSAKTESVVETNDFLKRVLGDRFLVLPSGASVRARFAEAIADIIYNEQLLPSTKTLDPREARLESEKLARYIEQMRLNQVINSNARPGMRPFREWRHLVTEAREVLPKLEKTIESVRTCNGIELSLEQAYKINSMQYRAQVRNPLEAYRVLKASETLSSNTDGLTLEDTKLGYIAVQEGLDPTVSEEKAKIKQTLDVLSGPEFATIVDKFPLVAVKHRLALKNISESQLVVEGQ